MYPVSDGVVKGVGSFSEAYGSTPTVKKPSVPSIFGNVTEPICQVRPIGVLWGKGQSCKVANEGESRCSELRSHSKLE